MISMATGSPPMILPVPPPHPRLETPLPAGGVRLRVGAVQYLNTRPLVHGLARGPVELVYDLPSRLADRLHAGDLDVALIPSVEFLTTPGYQIVSDACIACRGPVMSVKLFLRTRPDHVATLAVDEGSRTSVALARMLLAERHGARPAVATLPIGAGLQDTTADAVLLIGDRALGPAGVPGGGSFQLVWDLGDEWCRWTGLPFVFAVWAARPGVASDELVARLSRARDEGRANLAAIAAAEAAAHRLTVQQCLGYLRDNLHYTLGPREREALALFQRHVARLAAPDVTGRREVGIAGVAGTRAAVHPGSQC
jgi:chorismate dehydratase